MLADVATFDEHGSGLVQSLQKNEHALRTSVLKRHIREMQQSIAEALKPYQAMPIGKLY